MEYCCTSRSRRLSYCLLLLVLVCAAVLPVPPAADAAGVPRRLLQTSTCTGQDFDVPHAHLRARDNVRPLKYTEALSARAAQWAQRFKGDCAAAGPAPGVNVFLGAAGAGAGAAAWLPSDAVAAWAEEEQHYDYGSNSCSAGHNACGRYTQMMWRDTREFGCAVVLCDSGDTLMACHYEPKGNVAGQRPF
jgi:pathogenesis-related protein 1